MDAVTLSMAKAADRDWRKALLRSFDPYRDLPRMVGWWDTSTLTGLADASPVMLLRDRSGRGTDMSQSTAGSRPLVKATGLNGKPTLDYAGSKWLVASGMAVASSGVAPSQPASLAQPLTYIALVKAPVSGAGSNRSVMSGAAGSQVNVILNTFGSPQLAAGSNGASGGPDLSDGAWHILIGVFATGSAAIYVDGYLAATASNQSHGSNAASTPTLGAIAGGSTPFNGEIAEAMILTDTIRAEHVVAVTQYLSDKWGLGLTVPAQVAATPITATDGAGVTCRSWFPAQVTANTPVVILSHQSGGDSNIGTGYSTGYLLIQAAVSAGFAVIASDNGGQNTWGNSAAIASVAGAYTLLNTQLQALGGSAGKAVLLGLSMGGLPSALAAAGNTIAGSKIKGCATIDGALNLASMYANSSFTALIATAYSITSGTLSGATTVGATSIPTTASFPTVGTVLMVGNGTANVELVTTTAPSTGTVVAVTALTKTHASADQVSDYPTKTSGNDPVLLGAGPFAAYRWRAYASTADTAVVKSTNADQFVAMVAGTAVEATVQTHLSGHLAAQAAWPKDFIAFAKRCVA